MRLLRTLLNSGVFMILLLAAATLYLVYSDSIKRDHGLLPSDTASADSASSVSEVSQQANDNKANNVAKESNDSVVTPVTTNNNAEADEQAQSAPVFPTPDQTAASVPEANVPVFPKAESEAMPQAMMPPMMSEAMQQPFMQQPMMPPMVMEPMQQQPMQQPMMPPMVMEPMQQQPMQQPMMPPMVMEPMQQQPMQQPMQQQPQLSPLEQARMAFYVGDFVAAEGLYQQVLQQDKNPDIFGELGNVYYAQQNWQAAAHSYALAVDGLGYQGRFPEAQNLLGVVMQLNPELGNQVMSGLQQQMYPNAK